eukprot:scaffold5120_cov40-Cyclotella_meneghiniana.AAC.2
MLDRQASDGGQPAAQQKGECISSRTAATGRQQQKGSQRAQETRVDMESGHRCKKKRATAGNLRNNQPENDCTSSDCRGNGRGLKVDGDEVDSEVGLVLRQSGFQIYEEEVCGESGT